MASPYLDRERRLRERLSCRPSRELSSTELYTMGVWELCRRLDREEHQNVFPMIFVHIEDLAHHTGFDRLWARLSDYHREYLWNDLTLIERLRWYASASAAGNYQLTSWIEERTSRMQEGEPESEEVG